MEAEITLTCRSAREAEAVAKAVSPDNLKTPPGLTVKTERRGSSVVTWVKCERKLESLIATLDDLLMAVQVAEKAINTTK